jgi:hypothetical protein
MNFDLDQLDNLEHWITERDAIRHRKEDLGKPAPWTDDPVLRYNRFCNVRRMDDKVSRWLLAEWYHPMREASSRVLITAATLARHINWPDTLDKLKRDNCFAKKQWWNPQAVEFSMNLMREHGDKVFTGVYIINGAQKSEAGYGMTKVEQVVQRVDNVWNWVGAWPKGERCTSMATLHAGLMSIHGIGSFMAGQITADLRFTHVLGDATDAMQWAPRGPGSTRGMNRLLGNANLHAGCSGPEWQARMQALWKEMYSRSGVRKVLKGRQCELMDLQNCLCEFDKYMRVYNGEGRARNRYPGN